MLYILFIIYVKIGMEHSKNMAERKVPFGH